MISEIRRGYGPLIVLRDSKGGILMLPHVNEKVKKSEIWMYQGEKKVVCGYEFPGGACEEDESMEEAAVRELREEASIRVQPDRLERVRVGGILDQDRGGQHVHFGIELYELQLTFIEEMWTRLFKGAKNRDILFEDNIRPRDVGVLRLLDEYYSSQTEGDM